MINPLREYLDDTDEIVYDVDFTDDLSERDEGTFFNELSHNIGLTVIYFNTLENEVSDCLLESMNQRGEDSRVWVLIKEFSFDKKMNCLKEIYLQFLNYNENDVRQKMTNKIESLFNKINEVKFFRNLIVHCNWSNHVNLENFEIKVKYVKKYNDMLRIRKKNLMILIIIII